MDQKIVHAIYLSAIISITIGSILMITFFIVQCCCCCRSENITEKKLKESCPLQDPMKEDSSAKKSPEKDDADVEKSPLKKETLQ